MLERALAQLLPDFESRGVAWPEDEYEALQARSAQLRLPLDEEAAPARRGRLAASWPTATPSSSAGSQG